MAGDLLRRPEFSFEDLRNSTDFNCDCVREDVGQQVDVQIKYEGYIKRQAIEVDRQRAFETLKLPGNIDYEQVGGLSAEVRELLHATRPYTFGQASRISGITPAALSLLLIHVKKLGSAH